MLLLNTSFGSAFSSNQIRLKKLRPFFLVVVVLIILPGITPGQTIFTVADNFDTNTGLSGNDGTRNWTGDWVVSDNDVSISTTNNQFGGNAIYFANGMDADDNIYRNINMSGANFVTLTFDWYFNEGGGTNSISWRVDARPDASTNFTTLWSSDNLLDDQLVTGQTISIPTSLMTNIASLRFFIVSESGNNHELSIDNIVVTGSNTPIYCTPIASNVRPITRVIFNNLDNSSSALTSSPSYENFTAYTADVVKGQSYSFTVKGFTNGDNPYNYAVYFDWDNNGTFSYPGEYFAIGTIRNSTGVDAKTASASIAIPIGAVTGNIRMRVIANYNSYSEDPCDIPSNYGQVEDYSVNVIPACTPPTITTHPSTASQTLCIGSSATALSVTATGTGLIYQWYSNATSSTSGGTLISGSTSASYTPSTAAAGTLYYYCVVSSGGCSTTSNVSGAITVVSPPVPDFSATVTNATCPASTDGAISITGLPTALTFARGDDDYVNLGSNFLSGLTQFTIEGWIKVNKSNIGDRMGLFGQNDAIEFGFINNTQIECYTAATGAVQAPLSSYPNDNGWHHIAAVGTLTNIIIYIDGVQVGAGGSKTAATSYGSSADAVKIGSHVYDAITYANGGFTGQIAKVGFYNTALSAAAISSLAAGFTNYVSGGNLLAGYNFYEGTGNSLGSVTATGNGAFVNSPVWTELFNYTWTKTGDGSFSATTKNLSNISVGEYNIAVSNGSCQNSQSFTVSSINTASTDPAGIAGITTICSGATTTLTVSGGSLGTGASWNWYSGTCGGTSVGTGNSISVSPTTTTTYFVRAEGTCNTTNCATTTVTVRPAFTAGTISNTGEPICSGTVPTTQIGSTTDASGGDNTITYQWQYSTDNTFSAGVTTVSSNSATYTPTQTLTQTTYYRRQAHDGTCNTSFTPSSGVWEVTVNPTNTIALTSAAGTDNQLICRRENLTPIEYATTGATGASVTGLPTGISASFSNNTVTISGDVDDAAGIYNYTVTLTGGCGNASTTGNITIQDNADVSNFVVSATDICVGGSTTLTMTSTSLASGTYDVTYSVEVNGPPEIRRETVEGVLFTGSGGTVSATFQTLAIDEDGVGTIIMKQIKNTDCRTFETFPITPIAEGTFNVFPTSVGGTVAPANQTVCSGNNPLDLTLGENIGSVVKWQKATDMAFTTPVDIAVTSATLAGNTIGPINATTYFRAVVQSGVCAETYSSVATIGITPDNTISLTSAVGTDAQTVCINNAITNITYATTGATGIDAASGLPDGVTASFGSNIITISGTPTESGTFNYIIPLTGGCGSLTATGTIIISPLNTITLTSVSGTENQTVPIQTAIVNITYATTGATNASVTGLPDGVTGAYNAGVVTISGTPTFTGTYNYDVNLTGGCGTASASGTITVTNSFDVWVEQPGEICNAASALVGNEATEITTPLEFTVNMATGNTSWNPLWQITFTLTVEEGGGTLANVQVTTGSLSGSGLYTVTGLTSAGGNGTVNIKVDITGNIFTQQKVKMAITEAKTAGNISDKDNDDQVAEQIINPVPPTSDIQTN